MAIWLFVPLFQFCIVWKVITLHWHRYRIFSESKSIDIAIFDRNKNCTEKTFFFFFINELYGFLFVRLPARKKNTTFYYCQILHTYCIDHWFLNQFRTPPLTTSCECGAHVISQSYFWFEYLLCFAVGVCVRMYVLDEAQPQPANYYKWISADIKICIFTQEKIAQSK